MLTLLLCGIAKIDSEITVRGIREGFVRLMHSPWLRTTHECIELSTTIQFNEIMSLFWVEHIVEREDNSDELHAQSSQELKQHWEI